MFLTFLGKRYRFRYVRMKHDYGQCDNPIKKGKEIRICPGQTERQELGTCTHEAMHALAWKMLDEAWVAQASEDLATMLWRLGWRKVAPAG